MYHPFSVPDTLKTAWYLLRKNFAVIAIYTLLTILIIGVIGALFIFVLTDSFSESIGIVIMLVSVSFIFLGFIKLVFQLIDREYYDFDFADIVPKAKMLFSYLLLLIIVSTLSFVLTRTIAQLEKGLAQSILGIVVWAFFQFFFLFYFPICACFIVDDSSGPFESIGQSFQLIRGNFLKYFFLFVIIEAMVFVSSILYGIGLLFVVPFVNIILVVAYRKLVYSHQDVEDEPAETN
jgi:uncharacterized membrane protein